MRVWPRPVKTDDQGRITLRGIGRGAMVGLRVNDLRYARQDLYVDSAKASAAKRDHHRAGSRPGSSRAACWPPTPAGPSRMPLSRPPPGQNEHANGYFTAKFRADDQGRFTMNPIAGESSPSAPSRPAASRTWSSGTSSSGPRGRSRRPHDIRVRRGVLIRGKVTEQGTDRPLAASSIQYIPVRGGDSVLSGWQATVASQDDGSFQIAVPPARGTCSSSARPGITCSTRSAPTGSTMIGPAGCVTTRHAIIPYEVKAGDPPHEVAAALRPGVTIKGRVHGPDGQTITDGFVLTTLRIEAFNPHWRGDYQLPIRDGRFELHGLDPEASTRIHVLDPEHEWGATVEVSGKQAGEDVTIRLQPCGQAKARFIGPDGKPITKHRPHFEIVVTPGPSPISRDKREQTELAADASLVANVDRKHYWRGPFTDAEGRITLPALIPGALYRIIDFSTVSDPDKGVQIRRGLLCQARRDPGSGRYPDRETAVIGRLETSIAGRNLPPQRS